MVVQPRLAPVVHQHRQVEVVRLDDPAGAFFVALRADALLDVLARAHDRFHTIVEGHRRTPRRAGQALLQARGYRIEPPGVRLQRHAGHRRGRIDVDQCIVLAADPSDGVEGLCHGGRRIPLHDGDELRAMPLHRVLDLLRVEHGAPSGLDGDDVGAAAVGDLAQQMAEPPEDRDEHPVTGDEHGRQDRLDARAGGPVDQEGPPVGGAEHFPVERHHLVHVPGEVRVELPEQRQRHRLKDAGIDLHRAGAHQPARRGVQWLECVVHEGSSRRSERRRRLAAGGWFRWTGMHRSGCSGSAHRCRRNDERERSLFIFAIRGSACVMRHGPTRRRLMKACSARASGARYRCAGLPIHPRARPRGRGTGRAPRRGRAVP